MGYIKKLKNNELVGGTDKTTIYPVTSTEAVFEEVIEDGESNFKSQKFLNNNITGDRINKETITDYNIAVGTVTKGKLTPQVQTMLDEGQKKALTPKGDYDAETVYEVLDLVFDRDSNSSYISLITPNTEPLTNEDAWEMFLDGTAVNTAQATINNKVGQLETQVGDAISQAEQEVYDAKQETLSAYTEAEELAQQITDWSSSEISSTPSYTDQHPLSNRASSAQVGYFECGTSSTTQASNQIKAVTAGGYALPTSGGAVKIKMYAANTYTPTTNNPVKLQFNADAITLKELRYNDEAVSPDNTWEDGEVISVYYDGSVYQASNAQGGSNKKINAYLYGDLRTLSVGETYTENEAVKTTDKQLLRVSKGIKAMNITDEIAVGDLKTYGTSANASTYKALKEVKVYDGTETEGLYAIGRPSLVTITVDSSSLAIEEDTDITVAIGGITNTITVTPAASETKDADIAALIAAAFTTIEGWALTDNEDGTLTLKCNTAGNNTISVSSDTGETGLSITSSAVNGNSTLNQYNNGSWGNVTLAAFAGDYADIGITDNTKMWQKLSIDDLVPLATVQNTLVKTAKAESISYSNLQSGLATDNVQGAVDELNSGLNDYEEISWISVSLHNGWINDSQNWASRPNTRYRVWPVAEGEVYKLTTNSVGAIQAAWLASYNYSSDPISGSPDFAPNYAGKLPQQAINTTKEYIVPSGAHFLYILYYVNGSNRTPSYWGKKYNKIDTLAERVSANENALQNINVENLDFSGDVTNDLVLSDENYFDIAQFRNGHFFTKNFASDKMKIAAYLQNRCSGKICAIVGDSISSYDGQAPSGYAYYYPQGNVNNVNATWWKITCDILGMTPVNCAWSGSKTIGAPKGATAVAGCSDQRIADCGRNGTPDIIIFYMGTNDFGNEVALGTWDVNTAIIDDSEYTSSQQISNFRDAYALMLKKARVAYPDAKIYCCTLIDTVTLDSNAGWPSNNGNGVTIYTWNENIKEIAVALGCSVIDLHSCGLHFFNIENHSVDATKGKVAGLHPDSWGHIQIAAKVITHLISE